MANDISIPAALIFIDSLGNTLPFRKSFTFKELNDFCLREGIHVLANKDVLSEDELLKISYIISQATNGHVEIESEPSEVKESSRTPLSLVDLNVAQHTASFNKTCKRCGESSGFKTYCTRCYNAAHKAAVKGQEDKKPVEVFAHVILKDGRDLHVVEIIGSKYVGVDDKFFPHEFGGGDVRSYENMSEDLDKIAAIKCAMCGEKAPSNSAMCFNCGYTWQEIHAS